MRENRRFVGLSNVRAGKNVSPSAMVGWVNTSSRVNGKPATIAT
jgi:hypothetical protein